MKIRLEFKPQDLWIGAYWKTEEVGWHTVVDLWVCIVPMLPIHFNWFTTSSPGESVV